MSRPIGRHLPRGAPMLAVLLAAIAAAQAPAPAQAQSYEITDVETLGKFTIDALVTCPLVYGSYVSGGEGCPTGRAPISGECGLSFECPMPAVSIPDGLLTADHFWTQLVAQPIVLDMGQPTETVFVMNAADHFPFPEEAVEWTVWGSDLPDVTGFPAGWTLSSLCAIFKQGWVETGDCPAEDADDYVGLYQFPTAYRYVAVYANFSITIFTDPTQTTWAAGGDDDPVTPGWQSSEAELDAVARPDGPPPTIDAGPDLWTCTGYTLGFEARGTGTILRWAWDATGDGLPEATGPVFVYTFPIPGVYTVTLTALGTCGCAEDSVEVTVRDCSLAAGFASASARRLGGVAAGAAAGTAAGAVGVEVSFRTLREQDTLGFSIQRAPSPSGPWQEATAIEARGAHSDYRVFDADAPERDPLWYRLVERTPVSDGDVSAAFAAEPLPARSSGQARRRAWSR